MRKVIITLGLLIIGLCLIAVGLTFHQNLEYDTLIFLLVWQQQFGIL